MEIPKDKILELLRSRGEEGRADQADPSELLGKFGGGKISGL